VAGHLALSVLAVSGLPVFLHSRGFARALDFSSGAFLVVAYIGVSAFPAADLPRYLGDVSRIRSLCFRAVSKEAVWRSLLFAICSHRRVFFRLFWRICTEESIYQQRLWAIAIWFNFLRRSTTNTHTFTDASPRHLFDRLAQWSLHC